MRAFMVLIAGAALSGCGLVTQSASSKVDGAGSEVFEGPVGRAICGPGSRPEPDLQGRTRSIEAAAAELNAEGFSCNLELMGAEGNAALWQMAWYEDCAYYGLGLAFKQGNTAGFVEGAPNVPAGGVAVVDAKDPAKPLRTTTLVTPAMLDPWESLKVNEQRGLLAGASVGVAGPVAFDVYDVKGDCSAPSVLSVLPVDAIGHEGDWAPDGLTYYSGTLPPYQIIDVSNPMAPVPIPRDNPVGSGHGLSISNDGNRMYAVGASCGNGLKILDTTAVQSREANPAMPTIGEVCWEDGGIAQHTIPVTIKGKPYVIFVDEGSGGGNPGMARIIDISDEKNPVVIAKLKDEIDMPDAAETRAADGDTGGFQYQGHYCGVPQREEPGVVACSYFWQGVRVFDIRDPYHPKEIAYIVPPGTANASAQVRFVKTPDGGGELWFTDQDHGFYTAKFTNGVWPFKD